MKTYKINILATALTKITHMMGSKGNESLINRESILYNNKIVQVPFLSGNAIRHKMIREPGALDLITQCNLKGKLSIEQVNFMMNGGSLTESSVSCNINKIYVMQQILPLYRLLGGSLKNQVLRGSLNVSFGFLFCKENQERIAKLLDDNEIIEKYQLKNFEHFISNFQYTRASAKTIAGIPECVKDNEEDNDNLMIYNGQYLIPGSMFLIQFHLINCSDIELGALLNALQCYYNSGCIIGGMGRIGHGSINIEFIDDDYNYSDLIAEYRNHNEKNSTVIENWFNETFPFVKKEVKEKTKKSKTETKKKEIELESELESEPEPEQISMFDALE